MKIRITFVYIFLAISLITFNTHSMVGTKRKEPEKEERITAQPTQQPLILKRRKVVPSSVKTLKEISKQKFIEAAPELDNLPELLESIPADELIKEIKKDFRTKLPFEENRLQRAQSEQEVENILYLGVNPNEKNRNGQTAINALIERGNLNAAFHLAAIADLALDYLIGVEDEKQSSEGFTFLGKKALEEKIAQDIASQPEGSQEQKNLMIIKNFLKATRYEPLDISSNDVYGITPLERALRRGDDQLANIIIQLMLKAKLRSVISGMDRKTYAEKRSELSLKDIKLNDELNNKELEWLPLSLAIKYTPQLVDTLIELGADINKSVENDKTLLMVAAQYNPSAIPALLKAGADVNKKDRFGQTALMVAASGTNPEAVKILLDAKANVNDDNSDNETALFYAARSDSSTEIIKLLIQAGADINHENDFGQAPLNFAAEYNPNAIEFLVKAGADINNKGNVPPLITALRGENEKKHRLQSIMKLLELGANPNSIDSALFDGEPDQTPLETAIEYFFPSEFINQRKIISDNIEREFEIINTLLKYGAKITKKNLEDAREYNQIADKSLPRLMDLFIPYLGDYLLKVVKQGDSKEVKNLLNEGVNPNFKDEINDRTPLELAIEKNELEIVQALLNAQAEITEQAIQLSEGNQEIFDLLNKKLAMVLG